jgi:hypothetical protein
MPFSIQGLNYKVGGWHPFKLLLTLIDRHQGNNQSVLTIRRDSLITGYLIDDRLNLFDRIVIKF